MQKLVVVILTFNSERIIVETVSQALKITDSILIVDSFSTDNTLAVVKDLGCETVSREFLNYSDQRNWSIDYVAKKSDWQLHLDSDEILDDAAISSIVRALQSEKFDAFLIKRKHYFMGRQLNFSGINAWHLRLFRSGKVRCEDRLYDQHFVGETKTKRLKGFMHDKNDLVMSEWINRHNRWSDLEVDEILKDTDARNSDQLRPNIFGDNRERTRFFKRLYYRSPRLFRSVGYFLYRYILKLGFLDGRAGFYFTFFQAFWFRVLIDVKVTERDSG